jgi:hypothetical protein
VSESKAEKHFRSVFCLLFLFRSSQDARVAGKLKTDAEEQQEAGLEI